MKENKVKIRMAVLLSIVCFLGMFAAGCSSSAPVAGDAAEAGTNEGQGMDGMPDARQNADSMPDTDKVSGTQQDSALNAQEDMTQDSSQSPQDNSEARWQVFDPDTAAAVDADFKGKVRRLEEDTFYIVEVKVAILEDGSLISSSPSTKAEIPDSDLIQVVYDENTHFYIRPIYDGGERYEDAEAGVQDLKENMEIDMKGSFQGDIFYADEIRMLKVL